MSNSRKAKRKRKTTKKKEELKIDSHQNMLKARELFLYDSINSETSERLIKDLKTLNLMNKKPIKLYINSPGGTVSGTFAIVNTIKSLKSKVITIINALAASGAAIISICGDERLIVNNGVWMAHDLKTAIDDYGHTIDDRNFYLKQRFKQMAQIMKDHTDLTTREINKARHGELWLFPEDALDKGVVDKIIEPKS